MSRKVCPLMMIAFALGNNAVNNGLCIENDCAMFDKCIEKKNEPEYA